MASSWSTPNKFILRETETTNNDTISYKENYYFGQEQQVTTSGEMISDDSEPYIKIGTVQGNIINKELFNPVSKKSVVTKLAELLAIDANNPYVLYNNSRQNGGNSLIYKSGYRIKVGKMYPYRYQDQIKLNTGFWNYTTRDGETNWFIDYEDVGYTITDKMYLSRNVETVNSVKRYLNDAEYESVAYPSAFKYQNTSMNVMEKTTEEGIVQYLPFYGIDFEYQNTEELSATLDIIQQINGYYLHKTFDENEYIKRSFNKDTTENVKTNYVFKLGFGDTIPETVSSFNKELENATLKLKMSNIYNSWLTAIADISFNFGSDIPKFTLETIDDNFGCVRDFGGVYSYTDSQGRISKTRNYKDINPAYISNKQNKYLALKPKDSITKSVNMGILFYPEIVSSAYKSKVYKSEGRYINKLPYDLRVKEHKTAFIYVDTSKQFQLTETPSKTSICKDGTNYVVPTLSETVNISDEYKNLVTAITSLKSNSASYTAEDYCIKVYIYEDETGKVIYSTNEIETYYLKISEQPEFKQVSTTLANMKANNENSASKETVILDITLVDYTGTVPNNAFKNYIFNIIKEDGSELTTKSVINNMYLYTEVDGTHLSYDVIYPERRLYARGYVDTLFNYEDTFKTLYITNKDFSVSTIKPVIVNLSISKITTEDGEIANMSVDEGYIKHEIIEQLDSETKFFDYELYDSNGNEVDDHGILSTLLDKKLVYTTKQDYSPDDKTINVVCAGTVTTSDLEVEFSKETTISEDNVGGKKVKLDDTEAGEVEVLIEDGTDVYSVTDYYTFTETEAYSELLKTTTDSEKITKLEILQSGKLESYYKETPTALFRTLKPNDGSVAIKLNNTTHTLSNSYTYVYNMYDVCDKLSFTTQDVEVTVKKYSFQVGTNTVVFFAETENSGFNELTIGNKIIKAVSGTFDYEIVQGIKLVLTAKNNNSTFVVYDKNCTLHTLDQSKTYSITLINSTESFTIAEGDSYTSKTKIYTCENSLTGYLNEITDANKASFISYKGSELVEYDFLSSTSQFTINTQTDYLKPVQGTYLTETIDCVRLNVTSSTDEVKIVGKNKLNVSGTSSIVILSLVDDLLKSRLYTSGNSYYMYDADENETTQTLTEFTTTEDGYTCKVGEKLYTFTNTQEEVTTEFIYEYVRGRAVILNQVIKNTTSEDIVFKVDITEKIIKAGETYTEKIYNIEDKLTKSITIDVTDYKYHTISITNPTDKQQVVIKPFYVNISSALENESSVIKTIAELELKATMSGKYVDLNNQTQTLTVEEWLPAGKYKFVASAGETINLTYFKDLTTEVIKTTDQNKNWVISGNVYKYVPVITIDKAKCLAEGSCAVSTVVKQKLNTTTTTAVESNKYILSYFPIKHDAFIKFGQQGHTETVSDYAITETSSSEASSEGYKIVTVNGDKYVEKSYTEYANNFVSLVKPVELDSSLASYLETLQSYSNTQYKIIGEDFINFQVTANQVLKYGYTNATVVTTGLTKWFDIEKSISIGFKLMTDEEENILYNISGNDIGISCCMTVKLDDESADEDLKYGIIALGSGSNFIGETYGIQNSELISHHVEVKDVADVPADIGRIGNLKIKNSGNMKTIKNDTLKPQYEVNIYFDFICTREEMKLLGATDSTLEQPATDVEVVIKFVPTFDFFLPGKGLVLTFVDEPTSGNTPSENETSIIDLPTVNASKISPEINVIYKSKDNIPELQTPTVLDVSVTTIYFNKYGEVSNNLQCNNPNNCFGVEANIKAKNTQTVTNIPIKKPSIEEEFLKQVTQEISYTTLVNNKVTEITQTVENQIVKVKLDFFNRTTGSTGAYSYKSYGYILMDMCDFACCYDDFNIDTSGVTNRYNINFKALKNLFKYKNGKIKNSITDVEYNDNITIYQRYVDDDGSTGAEITEITELKDITAGKVPLVTLLHSTNALLKMFESYPNGYLKLSLIMDYYYDPLLKTRDASSEFPSVGSYSKRDTYIVKCEERFTYAWDSINKYNCRQYVSYPNTIPYEPKIAFNGINDENYNNQFIGTFALKNCDVCKTACCDHIENEDAEETVEENVYYPILSSSRPATNEQGPMTISRKVLDKTPIYITTMLPEDKRDELDGLTYSAQLLDGTILFTEAGKGNVVIQTNTYTVTFDENENSIINLTTVDKLGNEKKYTIKAEIVELIETDISSPLVDDDGGNNTYGYVKRFDDNYYAKFNTIDIGTDEPPSLTVMKKGITSNKKYIENVIISGNTVTEHGSEPTIYLNVTDGSSLYLEVINDGNDNNSNLYEYIREGTYSQNTGSNKYIYWGIEGTPNVIASNEISQVIKSCDYFEFVNKVGDFINDRSETTTVYKIEDWEVVTDSSYVHKYITDDVTKISYEQNAEGKKVVEEINIKTNYKELNSNELFFNSELITKSKPYGYLFIGNGDYVIGESNAGVTYKRQCYLLQKFTYDTKTEAQFLDTQKHILDVAKSYISVGICKQIIKEINGNNFYVNIFYNTNAEGTEYSYYVMLSYRDKIINTKDNEQTDVYETKFVNVDKITGIRIENSDGYVRIDDDSVLVIPVSLTLEESISENVTYVMYDSENPAITVIKDGSIKSKVETDTKNIYYLCKDSYKQSLSKNVVEENVIYPAVPDRKYISFYIPVENDYLVYDDYDAFDVNISNFTASYKNGSFVASSLDNKVRTYTVKIKDDNTDESGSSGSSSGSSSSDKGDKGDKEDESTSTNLLDTFFIDVGNYSSIENLVAKINSSVKDNLNKSVDMVDKMQISFKEYMSLNVAVPRIVLAIDVNNKNYNIIIDYEDFDLYSFKVTFSPDKKYTIMYTEKNSTQTVIAKFATMQTYVLDFMGDNSTFNPVNYFNQLETVININIPNTFPVTLSDVINNSIITDKFFNDIIIQEKPMLELEKVEGRYRVNINSAIIPVEFTSEDIPENIDYLRLVKKYQNYQQDINENSGKLSTFDVKTELVTPFSDSNTKVVDYLSTYFNSENFGISFKHNIHNVWYKLGITPLKIDKNKRPYISGPDSALSIIQTNLFSSFNKIIWYNYLSSGFVETSYLSDTITLPHNYIIGSNNSHKLLTGDISLSEHSELFNTIWEAENRPRLNVPLKFSIKTTRNQDVEYTLNIGNNETTISDIDKYTIDDNNQMKLNIFKTINTGEIDKMYIYIDSNEHYPFDTGVNATLSVEWIK